MRTPENRENIGIHSTERSVSSDVLQMRADLLIEGLQRMFDNGLELEQIIALEQENPRAHRDMLQVYLGLKPAATFLHPVEKAYSWKRWSDKGNRSTNTAGFEFFPQQQDSRITVLRATGIMWNPHLVEQVLLDNLDITQNLRHQLPTPYGDQYGFSSELARICSDGNSSTNHLLAGLLLGYPRTAVELFTRHEGRIIPHSHYLAERARHRGIYEGSLIPESVDDFVRDIDGVRAEFVRLERLLMYRKSKPRNALKRKIYKAKQEYVEYMAGLRYAEVPGSPFVTSGDLTLEKEKVIRDRYEASGLDAKLEELLESAKIPH